MPTGAKQVAEVKCIKRKHIFSAIDNLIQDILTCQNKAQLLVSTIIYRNTPFAKGKALYALDLQIPKDNGTAHLFYCPGKQGSESCHRQTSKLDGFLLFSDVHYFPCSSWITGLGMTFLWKTILTVHYVLWNEGPTWHTGTMVIRFRVLQMQNILEPWSTVGNLHCRALYCFIQ